MGFSKIDEVIAYQLASAFKLRVYQLVREHPEALRDSGFRAQLIDAARSGQANVREGFKRYKAPIFYQFLSYARSSIEEALGWLADGIESKYFTTAEVAPVAALGYRAIGAAAALQRSLKRFIPSKPVAAGRSRKRPRILRAPIDEQDIDPPPAPGESSRPRHPGS